MHLTLFCITDLCSAMKPCFDAFCTPVFSLLREILSAALDDQLIEHHRLYASCVSSSLRGWQSNPRAGRRNGLQGSFPPSQKHQEEAGETPALHGAPERALVTELKPSDGTSEFPNR